MPRISPMTFSPLPLPPAHLGLGRTVWLPVPCRRVACQTRAGSSIPGAAKRRSAPGRLRVPTVAVPGGGELGLQVPPSLPLGLPVLDGLLEQCPRRSEIGLHGAERRLRLLNLARA